MKKWSYLFMTMGIATAFSACSDEVDLSANNEESTEESTSQVFMQFNLELPAVSRSTTQTEGGSDAGVEIGKDYENQVSEVLVVITDATDDKFITGSTVTNLIPTGNNTTYVVPFNTNKLVDYAGDPVNIYVYCNPTSELKKGLDSEDGINVNATYTLTDATNATIWTKNKFLMTNADDDYERTLPANLDNYKVESNPFDLETIKVERAVARFDYKTSVDDETYTLMEDKEGHPEVTVTLTDMALVNLSKEFYYLRRVSADGTSTNATIGGTETNTNYVVDTDYEWKGKYSEETTDKASHFFYVYNPNSASTTDYAWTSISSLTSEDNDESWNSGENANVDRKGYKIWRYATENTIPAQVSNQKKGITTGVVFKGEIQGKGDMANLLNGEKTVYVFDNILWGTWDDVRTAAEAKESDNTTLANPLLAAAYNEAMKGGYSDPKAVTAGFTIFRPNTTTKKYEVLYYYWNRHNDNNNNGSMGPMEFAVVRNNVYKLSVTGVNKFGHPTNPGDDPDPENPEDPDEEDDVYFRVAVEVLPWVVRINDIEF